VHEQIAQGLKDHPARKGVLFNVLVTVVEIGGSIALFHLAQSMGASDVVSYLVGSIGPVIGGFVIWVKARKFSGASASIFAFTAISAIIAFIGSTTPKALLYKDCAATALIGLIFLGSCVVAKKPLAFYMAQRYGTDGTHDGMATFDRMWGAYGEFRRAMYVISLLWAALFLIQAAGTALIIHQTSYSTAYNYDQILPLVATAVGIFGSIAIGRYFTRKGRARAVADHATG
jgi:hypothetical protein